MKNNKTILYAEDDAVTLTAYKNRLEEAGYTVLAAKDGVEALRLLHGSPPDLVLLDLMLPKFTGEDVLKYISTNPPLGQIPVVVLSTNSVLTAENEPLVERAQKHFLKHDCTFPKLLTAIEEVFAAGSTAVAAEAAASAVPGQPAQADNPFLKDIEELKAHAPVVCA